MQSLLCSPAFLSILKSSYFFLCIVFGFMERMMFYETVMILIVWRAHHVSVFFTWRLKQLKDFIFVLCLHYRIYINCWHFIYAGRKYGFGRSMHRFSTAAVLDEPIAPPVQINYTKLLINGKFVDSASGCFTFCFFLFFKNVAVWSWFLLFFCVHIIWPSK